VGKTLSSGMHQSAFENPVNDLLGPTKLGREKRIE